MWVFGGSGEDEDEEGQDGNELEASADVFNTTGWVWVEDTLSSGNHDGDASGDGNGDNPEETPGAEFGEWVEDGVGDDTTAVEVQAFVVEGLGAAISFPLVGSSVL